MEMLGKIAERLCRLLDEMIDGDPDEMDFERFIEAAKLYERIVRNYDVR